MPYYEENLIYCVFFKNDSFFVAAVHILMITVVTVWDLFLCAEAKINKVPIFPCRGGSINVSKPSFAFYFENRQI